MRLYLKFYWHYLDDVQLCALLIGLVPVNLFAVLLFFLDSFRTMSAPGAGLLFISVMGFALVFAGNKQEKQAVHILPCSEFVLASPISRYRLYYGRLVIGICCSILPMILLGIWTLRNPDVRFTASEFEMRRAVTTAAYQQHFSQASIIKQDKESSRTEISIPWGNVYVFGWFLWGWLLTLLLLQALLLLPIKKVYLGFAPSFLAGLYFCYVWRPSLFANAFFVFVDWWWLASMSMVTLLVLVQLVTWRRLRDLQPV